MKHLEVTPKVKSVEEPFSYEGLKRITAYFEAHLSPEQREKLVNIEIVACQHILEPQLVMYEQMIQLGIIPKNIHVLGKIYSTSFDVLDEMKEKGVDASQPPFDSAVSFDVQHRFHSSRLIDKVSGSKHEKVILDDGGELLRAAMDAECSPLGGVEQTSSGFRKLENEPVNFPIINVARSSIKLQKETPFVIRVAMENLLPSMDRWGLKNPDFLVLGQGPIGIEMSRVLSQDFSQSSYDNLNGSYDPVELILNSDCDVVVGTTGSQVLTHDQLIEINKKTKKPLYFVSMSSSDREFELWKMRDLFNQQTIHEDVVFENITVANNGFPITFKGRRNGATPAEMERTISLLFGSTIHAATSDFDQKGFMEVPEYIINLID